MEKIYRPDELLFVICKDPEAGNPWDDIDEDDLSIGDTVAFTSKKYFEEEGYQSDDLGGHNMPQDILEKCGVCPCELMESVFELTESPDYVYKQLLKHGFTENEKFTELMKNI